MDSQHKELSRLIENIEHPQIATEVQRRQLNVLTRLNREHRIDDWILDWTHEFRVSSSRFECRKMLRMHLMSAVSLSISRKCTVRVSMLAKL